MVANRFLWCSWHLVEVFPLMDVEGASSWWMYTGRVAPASRYMAPGQFVLQRKLNPLTDVDWMLNTLPRLKCRMIMFPSISDYFCSCWIFWSCCDVILMCTGYLLVEHNMLLCSFFICPCFKVFLSFLVYVFLSKRVLLLFQLHVN